MAGPEDSTARGARPALVGGGVHEGAVNAVAFAARDGRACAVTGDGLGTLRVIDLQEDAVLLEKHGLHSGSVSAIVVAAAGDGRALSVSAGFDGRLAVVELGDGSVLRAQSVQEGPVTALALAHGPSGPVALTGHDDGSVRALALEGTGEPAVIAAHGAPVRSLDVTRGRGPATVISGGEDGVVRLIVLDAPDAPDGALRGHTGAVHSVAWCELDGRSIALCGDAEGTLRLWDVARPGGAPIGEPLRAHAAGVVAVAALTLDGRAVAASAGFDGTVRAWDLRALGALGEPLRGHDGAVLSVALGVLGARPVILSGGADTTARLWDLPGFAGADGGDGESGADDRVEWVSDARATVDLLQRGPLAEAIATRLRRLREDEPGRSFLIHIDGRWGSGKSTLLDLVRRELADDWLVVEFDAWRQMRVGPPWWALLASLRHAVRRGMGTLGALQLRMSEAALRVRRGGALYVVAVAALLAIAATVALLLGARLDLGGWGRIVSSILAVSAGIGALYAALSAVGRFLLWDSAAGARVFEQSHRDPMESVADHFAWLIARAGRPVVFFVDDLDRCSKEYVVDLLDSVQTLIRDAPGRTGDDPDADRACYVVVAADGRWIRTGYEHAHEGFADAVEEPGRPLGYLFLDKIFQLTVPVPSISPQRQAAYLRALLHVGEDGSPDERLDVRVRDVARRVAESTTEAETLEAFDEAPADVRAAVAGVVVGKLAQPQIEASTRHRLERFSGLLETNPRAMKLVLNAYGMARASQVIEDNVVPGDALALWTILRVRWPALADHLCADPEAVDALVAGRAPEGAPAGLARLFAAPAVRRVVDCEDGGPLSAATIRACCGLPEDEPLSSRPPAGTP
ncbi:MAG TPA: P-loop NTPase fold protein [Solirubrobacteraceae bacterium]|nr:P-loop NTPase fold protein [Solirubrobacteraceae bacterium]